MKNNLKNQYLNILKNSLLNNLYIESEARILYILSQIISNQKVDLSIFQNISKLSDLIKTLKFIKKNGHTIAPAFDYNPSISLIRNYTEHSHTMIGELRLDNLRNCFDIIIKENIKGDFIEAGIWRGGACIFLAGLLFANDINDRKLFCADSFEGVPKPSNEIDNGFDISVDILPILSVSQESVEELFNRYNLLNSNVIFLKGWFKDTLHRANIESLSLLRLDGDLYESTMDSLNALYHKVSIGGFVIVDDYFSCQPCKLAVDEFKDVNSIYSPLIQIDAHSVFWRKY